MLETASTSANLTRRKSAKVFKINFIKLAEYEFWKTENELCIPMTNCANLDRMPHPNPLTCHIKETTFYLLTI